MSRIDTYVRDIEQTGYEAFVQGEARSDCPYARGTAERELWMSGYSHASQLEDRTVATIAFA